MKIDDTDSEGALLESDDGVGGLGSVVFDVEVDVELGFVMSVLELLKGDDVVEIGNEELVGSLIMTGKLNDGASLVCNNIRPFRW